MLKYFSMLCSCFHCFSFRFMFLVCTFNFATTFLIYWLPLLWFLSLSKLHFGEKQVMFYPLRTEEPYLLRGQATYSLPKEIGWQRGRGSHMVAMPAMTVCVPVMSLVPGWAWNTTQIYSIDWQCFVMLRMLWYMELEHCTRRTSIWYFSY